MFEVPNWDQESQKKARDALLVLAASRSCDEIVQLIFREAAPRFP
ncbi:MAG: hypothetical protein ACREDV_08315 [Methylocella sp.]